MVEGQVLFVSIEFLGADKNVIYALDISSPADTDAEDDLLDSFVMDDIYRIYNMASTSGYLYIAGQYDTAPVLFVMDISDPTDLSLVKTIEIESEMRSIAVAKNGGYLFTTVNASYESGPFDDSSFEFTVFSISDPENPRIISSSVELTGDQIFGYENIVLKDNYAYVATSTHSIQSKSRIYVFDISNPEDPDLVETSKNIAGIGLNLYLAGGNLCLHTTQYAATEPKGITMFNISDPENLSVIKTIDLASILKDELPGWGFDQYLATSYGLGPYSNPYVNPNSNNVANPSYYGYGLMYVNPNPNNGWSGQAYTYTGSGGPYGYGYLPPELQ